MMGQKLADLVKWLGWHRQRVDRAGQCGSALLRVLLPVTLGGLLGSVSSATWAAAYATGGSSVYRDSVLWLTWGGGTNGRANVRLGNSSQTSAEVTVANGTRLIVTCTLSNLTGRPLASYAPGAWSGDSLDLLYNIGGSGSKNQLVNAISTTSGSANFDITCAATLGDKPYQLKGLVMADAEAIATLDGREYVKASAPGTWNVVEMRKNGTNGTYIARKSEDAGIQRISFGPGTDNRTAAVTFLSFNADAYQAGDEAVSMNFSLKGGGTQAIAIGLLVPYADFGDAPASYGDAMHLVPSLQFRDDHIPNDQSINLNSNSYQPGGLIPPTDDFLGSIGPDTENFSHVSDDALGDDDYPTRNLGEEDAWSGEDSISVLRAGQQITRQIACHGLGTVAGWIDFDRDGQFGSAERAAGQCRDGQATLSWLAPNTMLPGTSYVRLRYATNSAEIADAIGVANDGEVEDRRITFLAPQLSLTKHNNSENGQWKYGQTGLNYQLTVTNNGPIPTGDAQTPPATITILDQLPEGVEPDWQGTHADQGWQCTFQGQRVTCQSNQVLAAAGQSGASATLTLPVRLTAAAIGERRNHASVGGGHDPNNHGDPPEPSADCTSRSCAHDSVTVLKPTVTYAKAATPTGPVNVGETIRYTLTTQVSAGKTVDTVTLTDNLGEGLAFTGVSDPGSYTCQGANPLVCTLPAGTAEGRYSVTYTATVTRQANRQVSNQVTGSGADNPTCQGQCTVNTDLEPSSVKYQKTSQTQGPVGVGDTLTYTLTAHIQHSQSTQDLTLTDQLDDGLDFGVVTHADLFSCRSGKPLTCTLPAATAPGTYQVTYTATVNDRARERVANSVTASGGDSPSCDGTCQTTTALKDPTVLYRKSANTTGPVAVGDTVSYVIHADVTNARTTADLTLTDTLGQGLAFAAFGSTQPFRCQAGNPVTCVLPKGTVPGQYEWSYTAKVTQDASQQVSNHVGASGENPHGCRPDNACDVAIAVMPSEVRYRKSSSTAGPVKVGDILNYSMQVTVSRSKTTDSIQFTDTMGQGLDFSRVTDSGIFSCQPGNPLVCTLPKETGPGTYLVNYAAQVNDQASGKVQNALTGSGGTGPSCLDDCGVTTPVMDPVVRYRKQADHTGPVKVGDTITFTLTSVVENAKTTSDLTLRDHLGQGLDFGQIIDAGRYQCQSGDPLSCTLPSGTVPGSYSVQYTATVNAQATQWVSNGLSGSGGSPHTECDGNCTVQIPVAEPTIRYRKSSDAPASVGVGDVITYTLTTVVDQSQTTQDFTLTDTLGEGLTFRALTEPGQFSCLTGNTVTCTLPAHAVPGTYLVRFTATVNDQATGTVRNQVVAQGGGAQPQCESDCATSTPVTAPAVRYHKSTNTAGPVRVGTGLDYTVTTEVSHSRTSEEFRFTDTLDDGLTLERVTDSGAFQCDGQQPLTCRLAAGAVPGRYAVTYHVIVNDKASGQLHNTVSGSGGPDTRCEGNCTVTTPVANSAVSYRKSSNTAGPVDVGQILTYTLTAVVADSRTTDQVTLIDTAGTGLAFREVTQAGQFQCTLDQSLRCVLPAGTVPGSYTVEYTAIVTDQATGFVENRVNGRGNQTPNCADQCGVQTPVQTSSVHYHKAVRSPAAAVKVGDTLTYTLTTQVSHSQSTDAFTLTDTLGTGLDFEQLVRADGYRCQTGQPLTCTLPSGTVPGTYTIEYTAKVNAQATDRVRNQVVGTGGTTATCDDRCATETPVAATSARYSKSLIGAPAAAAVGDQLTYELTAVIGNSQLTAPLTLQDTLGEGLAFDAMIDQGSFVCQNGQPLTCTLPTGTIPGTYRVRYTATVTAQATGTVHNSLTGSGVPDARCDQTCSVVTPIKATQVRYRKQAEDPPAAAAVGQTLRYLLTVEIAQSKTTEPLTLTDTFGQGLEFDAISDSGPFACQGGQSLICTLPANQVPGRYRIHYTAKVNATATGSVHNGVTGKGGGGDPPSCVDCQVETAVAPSAVRYSKRVQGPTPVAVGQTLTYTLDVRVVNSKTTQAVEFTDTLGPGLDFDRLIDSGGLSCQAGQPLTCLLPADSVPGAYAVTYTAKVNAQATGEVHNSLIGRGGPNTECDQTCSVQTKVAPASVHYRKTANTQDAQAVGDTLTYTVLVQVRQSQTTEPVTVTDTLGEGLEFAALIRAEGLTCTSDDTLTCTLPTATPPGDYSLVYTAKINQQASGSVTNLVKASNPPGGQDPEPECDHCTVTTPIKKPIVTIVKQAKPAAGKTVRVGDTVAYTITVEISNSSSIEPVEFVDTMQGLTLQQLPQSQPFTCTPDLVCTLPVGTPPGRYTLTYLATVSPDAKGPIRNVVQTRVNHELRPLCRLCEVTHPLALPKVHLEKQAEPAPSTELTVGSSLQYRLTALVQNAPLLQDLHLHDTPDAGLTVAALPNGCTRQHQDVLCTLPAGTRPGTYTFSYAATVNADANVVVGNRLRGEMRNGDVSCGTCQTSHRVQQDFSLRITKTASAKQVHVGDLVRYTVRVENLGRTNWRGGTLQDSPPAGFSYVPGSLHAADDDQVVTVASGQVPLEMTQVDVAAGQSATLTYLLRVGAGVPHGNHRNRIHALGTHGKILSNEASAEVVLAGDPLLEDSTIAGSVFTDHDGDGWQDNADLTQVQVRGGFAPEAYVPGSTTIDRGHGPQPVADASAPLLHGILVGRLPGRNLGVDPAPPVVIRQRLRTLALDDRFTVTSAQGWQVQLGADGRRHVGRHGPAAHGLDSAVPTVERRVTALGDGYAVEYLLGNVGVHEMGLPGVRLATVDGILVETDANGRYHLAKQAVPNVRSGNNVVVKVDPATLPEGAQLTTENPLVRRVTAGIPVRFSFGARLALAPVELVFNERLFARGRAEIETAYQSVMTPIAEQLDQHASGTIVMTADGHDDALVMARAGAVAELLSTRLSARARAGLLIELRRTAQNPQTMVAAVDGEGVWLGEALFAADQASIPLQNRSLVQAIAQRLAERNGGRLFVVSRADRHGRTSHQRQLRRRRAQVIDQMLRHSLKPALRQRVVIVVADDSDAGQADNAEKRP